MDVFKAKRLRSPEDENTKLKRLLADVSGKLLLIKLLLI
jgi:hypothetical protein